VTGPNAEQTLTEDRRKDIFHALVDSQDRGTTVPESRREIARQFGVSEQQVQEIEREGLNLNWPPL
jgi:hypothetical protein